MHRAVRLALALLAVAVAAVAGEAAQPPYRHMVPADKKLPEAWTQGLFARGEATVWRGKQLDGVGMPIGGIGAGQVYLRGDGTMAYWRVFNREHSTGYGRECYQRPIPPSPVDQGFAVVVEMDGKTQVRKLSKEGFREIEFVGEYPIAIVRYRDDACPVRVEMEAFSPFIPLNAEDSALPATLFHITVTNASDKTVRARVLGWLENAVLHHSAKTLRATRRTQRIDGQNRTLLLHTAELAPPPKAAERPSPVIVLADLEGKDYGTWKVEGRAFGTGPARGTLAGQQPVSGFRGKGLVNTYLGGDDKLQGTLTSPPFALERHYVQFLIGGGNEAGRTCINLLVDGKVVRTAVGEKKEQLVGHFWDVRPFAGKQAVIQIVDKASGPWGHINIDHVELTDQVHQAAGGPIDQLHDYGSMALAFLGPTASAQEAHAVLSASGPAGRGPRAVAPLVSVLRETETSSPAAERRSYALLSELLALNPLDSRSAQALVAWHFPNQRHHGRHYAVRFRDARAVADYIGDHHARLAAHTRLWRDTFYTQSSLPHWLLERLHSTASNLATGTAQWWANGRFWGWEGVGCCAGTCTHVWNYAHAHARLFPSLARSAREMQDFGAGFHANGLVGFRSDNAYAADGQCGTLLKAYREHLTSADERFLRRNWPHIRQALRYCIAQDGDANGILEGSQHNTFDINFVGPNTFVGSLYLGALRAGEQMAREMGDEGLADECRAIYERGRQFTVAKMWDGEYFIQLVDLKQHPKHQYARGCLSDQLFGQGWAHQVGLGYLYPEDKVKTALASVWKYNWAPDIAQQNAAHPPLRWFARPGEAGLFTCTWPKSEHLEKNAVLYKNEIWTGIEYQVAGHMIWEGMVAEGLSVIRGIHHRYRPTNHNPYNEVECGDHYARALASWGCALALAGFEYHGPKGHLAFAPRVTPADFRAAFTAAEGWGTYAQTREGKKQTSRLDLRWGRLRLARLTLALPDGVKTAKAVATLDGKPAPARVSVDGGRLALTFKTPLRIEAGGTLQVEATW